MLAISSSFSASQRPSYVERRDILRGPCEAELNHVYEERKYSVEKAGAGGTRDTTPFPFEVRLYSSTQILSSR